MDFIEMLYGGEGGIRTHDPTFGGIPLFESGAFSHSATSPSLIKSNDEYIDPRPMCQFQCDTACCLFGLCVSKGPVI